MTATAGDTYSLCNADRGRSGRKLLAAAVVKLNRQGDSADNNGQNRKQKHKSSSAPGLKTFISIG
jgi:hypothetical protein